MDNQTPRFSIKLKILLSLAMITFFSIGLNLYFTIDIFTQDKTSYIFESALKESKQISENLVYPVQKIIEKLNYIVNLDNQKKIDLFFKESTEVSYFSHTTGNKTIGRFNKTDVATKDIESEIFKNTYSRPISVKGQLYYSIQISTSGHNIVLLVDLESTTKKLNRKGAFLNYLLSENGEPYNQKLDKNQHKKLKKLLDSKFQQGTRNIKIAGTDYLASYAKNKQYRFSVITLIEESKAFEVISILTKKTLFFGLILLGLAIAIGTLFAVSLTRPINLLFNFTKKVGNGEYDSQVEINTNDELKVLGNSFNSMTSKISQLLKNKEEMIKELQVANDKLEDYSKNLELLVEERTIELREAHNFMSTMINSLDQGLLVFDSESVCLPTYTKACDTLFGASPAGQHFSKLIGNTDEKEIESFNQWNNIVFSKKIPFESAVGLAPQAISRGVDYNDDEYQVINLNYYPMHNDEEEITNIVAVATDKTDEARAKEQFLNKEKYVEMVLKIVQNKKQFLSFLQEVEHVMTNIENNFKAVADEDTPFLVEKFLIDFHTLNGGFGMYSVLTLQQLARKIEGELVLQKEKSDEEKIYFLPMLEDYILEMRKIHKEFLQECAMIFGNDLDKERSTITVNKSYLEDLQHKLSTNADDALQYFEEYFIKVPIHDHFISYIELVKELQKRLDKQINPLHFEGSDLRVLPGQYLDFYQSLVHLFRNCCDHGIEEPFKREERGKDQAGTISIRTTKTESKLIVEITDDGGGIDPVKIREKLAEIDPDNSYEHIADDKIIYQIFEPHFSTADQLTSVSGRGVGMSAIKEVISSHKGEIELYSVVGTGTNFKFILPIDG